MQCTAPTKSSALLLLFSRNLLSDFKLKTPWEELCDFPKQCMIFSVSLSMKEGMAKALGLVPRHRMMFKSGDLEEYSHMFRYMHT